MTQLRHDEMKGCVIGADFGGATGWIAAVNGAQLSIEKGDKRLEM